MRQQHNKKSRKPASLETRATSGHLSSLSAFSEMPGYINLKVSFHNASPTAAKDPTSWTYGGAASQVPQSCSNNLTLFAPNRLVDQRTTCHYNCYCCINFFFYILPGEYIGPVEMRRVGAGVLGRTVDLQLLVIWRTTKKNKKGRGAHGWGLSQQRCSVITPVATARSNGRRMALEWYSNDALRLGFIPPVPGRGCC